jgi:hypothetical protein
VATSISDVDSPSDNKPVFLVVAGGAGAGDSSVDVNHERKACVAFY